MDNALYQGIKKYLKDGNIPASIPSTKSNFLATAEKFKINKKGCLTRNNKIVVTKGKMELEVFSALHYHSGRIACWNRIKQK